MHFPVVFRPALPTTGAINNFPLSYGSRLRKKEKKEGGLSSTVLRVVPATALQCCCVWVLSEKLLTKFDGTMRRLPPTTTTPTPPGVRMYLQWNWCRLVFKTFSFRLRKPENDMTQGQRGPCVCRQSGHLSCWTQGNVDVRNVYGKWHLVMCAITGKSVRLFVCCCCLFACWSCCSLPTGSFSLFSILYFLPIFLLSSIPCRVDNTPAGISFSFSLSVFFLFKPW